MSTECEKSLILNAGSLGTGNWVVSTEGFWVLHETYDVIQTSNPHPSIACVSKSFSFLYHSPLTFFSFESCLIEIKTTFITTRWRAGQGEVVHSHVTRNFSLIIDMKFWTSSENFPQSLDDDKCSSLTNFNLKQIFKHFINSKTCCGNCSRWNENWWFNATV